MAKKKVPLLDVAVSFGGVSIGDTTAKVSFTINRDRFDLEEADRFLCGKRLTGRLVVVRGDEDPNQEPLPGMEDNKLELSSVFDCKGFRATPKTIASGAVFLLESIDVSVLGHVAKKSGRLIIQSVEEASSGNEDEDD